jgi:chemotaxis protein MotB
VPPKKPGLKDKKNNQKLEAAEVVEGRAPTPPPPEEGLPAWMATFADMVTLLLCFFVLLLSFATMEMSSFNKLKGSCAQSFGVQNVNPEYLNAATSLSPTEASGQDESKSQQVMGLDIKLREFVQDANLKDEAKVSSYGNGVMLRVSNNLLFPQNSADLNPKAAPIINEAIKILNESNFVLLVRGHTDATETTSQLYNSNWLLSSARAAACIRYILGHSKIPPSRLIAVGYADSRPIVPNNSEGNRRINRRVEFYFAFPEEIQ